MFCPLQGTAGSRSCTTSEFPGAIIGIDFFVDQTLIIAHAFLD
jgi:hypothetical protein